MVISFIGERCCYLMACVNRCWPSHHWAYSRSCQIQQLTGSDRPIYMAPKQANEGQDVPSKRPAFSAFPSSVAVSGEEGHPGSPFSPGSPPPRSRAAGDQHICVEKQPEPVLPEQRGRHDDSMPGRFVRSVTWSTARRGASARFLPSARHRARPETLINCAAVSLSGSFRVPAGHGLRLP
jgi:hypothetical protein